MSLQSDVTVAASKFDRSTIDKQTLEFNEKLIKIWADGPRWYEVSLTTHPTPYPLIPSTYSPPLPSPITIPPNNP